MRQPDPRLVDVAQEVRRLRKEVADAEWNRDPGIDILEDELRHYETLQGKGVVFEPMF